jgi:hypothetical protein
VITAFLVMRYRETTGQSSIGKGNGNTEHGVEHNTHSSGSSDIESKKATQAVDTVKSVPERTISDETR